MHFWAVFGAWWVAAGLLNAPVWGIHFRSWKGAAWRARRTLHWRAPFASHVHTAGAMTPKQTTTGCLLLLCGIAAVAASAILAIRKDLREKQERQDYLSELDFEREEQDRLAQEIADERWDDLVKTIDERRDREREERRKTAEAAQ